MHRNNQREKFVNGFDIAICLISMSGKWRKIKVFHTIMLSYAYFIDENMLWYEKR